MVTSIDIEEADEVPGGWAVITSEDVAEVVMPPTPNPARNLPRRYPLVQGKVLMPGDPVAAVVAETAATAKDAADLVFVDYEPLDGRSPRRRQIPLEPKGSARGNWLNTRGGQRCRRRPGGADVQIPVTPEQIWRILLSRRMARRI